MTTQRQNKPATEGDQESAIDTAWRIHGALTDWTGKVDAKASFTLAIESASLAALATLSAKDRLFSARDGWMEHAGYWSGVGLLVVGVLLAGMTVRPRLRRTQATAESASNFIYFGHLRHWNESDLSKALATRDIVPVLSRQLIAMSKIAWTKHRRVQYSLLFAALGAVLVAAVGLSIQY